MSTVTFLCFMVALALIFLEPRIDSGRVDLGWLGLAFASLGLALGAVGLALGFFVLSMVVYAGLSLGLFDHPSRLHWLGLVLVLMGVVAERT